jgi:triacylglycerol lipase
LARVRAGADHLSVPHTSIIGGADRMVQPLDSARFPVGDVLVMPGRGHNMLLFDEEVMGIVLRRVRELPK